VSDDLDATMELAHEIRRQVMEGDGRDLRDQVAKLCILVSHLALMLQKNQRATSRAANVASCLANGIIPD
jgi:hypothetical protein